MVVSVMWLCVWWNSFVLSLCFSVEICWFREGWVRCRCLEVWVKCLRWVILMNLCNCLRFIFIVYLYGF